jgi:Uma2 family endonuclease
MTNASPKTLSRYFAAAEMGQESRYQQPVETPERQAISLRLAAALLHYAETEDLGQVLHTPGGILLSKQRIQPHVLFVARKRRGIIGKAGLHAPPDLIVDILPAQLIRAKKRLYAFYEIGEYWIVDPDTATIEVMIWSELGYLPVGRYGRGDRVASPLMPKLNLPVCSIFR